MSAGARTPAAGGFSVPRGLRLAAAVGLAAVLVAGVVFGVRQFAGAHPVVSPAIVMGRHGMDGLASWAPGTRPAPAIDTLHDQTGRRFSLGSLRGRPVAMEFFDSHCHAECPLAGRALAAAEAEVPAAERPVLVVVSVNPLDTRASVRAAIREWGLAGLAPWHWLMGTHAQLAAVWRAYHIYVQPERGDINHTEALYLIDRRGDERSGFLYPYVPRFVAHDIRILGAPAGRSGAVHG
jgi:cytochrome oxidase Cu insertion factor (SCO1/SenC/PrrC family)